jgi:ATP-dependent Lhr-like helicase
VFRSANFSAANVGVWSGWRRPLSRLPYLAVDLETTGLDPRSDRIIEFAAHGPAGLEFKTLIDPGDGIEFTGPHGLSRADLVGAPAFGEISAHVRRLLTNRIVIAHNARFDLSFLQQEFARVERPLRAIPFVCTMGLADALAFGHESRSLAHACHRHGVALVNAHRADGDARAAARLFEVYAAHADSFGFDLDVLSRFEGCTAGVESWSLAPLGSEHLSDFRSVEPAAFRAA